MKVTGQIDVIDIKNNRIIAHSNNNFTDVGRQHVCDWLLHNNYSEDVPWDGINHGQGGRSISDMRIIPYSSVEWKRVGTHSYTENPQYASYPYNMNHANYMRLLGNNQYWEDYPYAYNDEYGTIFYEFDKQYDLQGVMMYLLNRDNWDRQTLFEISTSPDTFLENQVTPNWERQTIDDAPRNWDDAWSQKNRCVNYRFDFCNHPNRIVKNVRTVRIRTCYLDWTTTWLNIYGIWFLEALPYPNTPSVISLGSGDTAPANTDTGMASEEIRKFVRKHKDMGNDTQIKYSMRLRETEGNDISFKEVGLNFLPEAGDYIGGDHGPESCTSLFSRGLFDTPWSKTSGQIIDVDYTLTISD